MPLDHRDETRALTPGSQDAENELDVDNAKFKSLGLDPILLDSAEVPTTRVTGVAASGSSVLQLQLQLQS